VQDLESVEKYFYTIINIYEKNHLKRKNEEDPSRLV
jgi:hypothetical protein